MSMWEYDEYGNPYPPDEEREYGYQSHHNHDHDAGSSRDYRGSAHDYHGSHGHAHHSSYHSDHSDHSHHGHSHGTRSSYGEGSHQYHQHQPPETPYYDGDADYERSVQWGGGGGIPGYDMSAGYESRPVEPVYESRPAPPAQHGRGGHGQATNTHDEHPPSRDLFQSESVVELNLDEINSLATNHRSRSWLVALYAPWCRFCQWMGLRGLQAMEHSFNIVAQQLERSNVYVGKFRADGDHKDFAKQFLQLESFPTILFFPKNSQSVVKYQSENREVEALLNFVYAFE